MAYRPRPDGLFDVDIPGGGTVPMSLSEAQLQGAGLSPLAAAPPMPAGPDPRLALAGTGGAPGMTSPAGMSVAPPAAPMSAMPATPSAGMGGAGGMGGAPNMGGAGPVQVSRADNLAGTTGAPAAEGMREMYQPPPEPSEAGAQRRGRELPATTDVPDPYEYTTPTRLPQPRVVRSPAKDVRAGWTHETGTPISGEQKKAIERPGVEADIGTAQAVQESTQIQQDVLQRREEQLLDQQEELEQRRAERAKVDSQIESRRHEVDRWESERRSSLNPTAENFWKDQPAKASVVAATSILANVFGGYAEGLSGATKNPARGMLEQATERWIQDQKEKHDRLASNKQGAENAYTEALKRYGSPEEAELGMRIEAMAIEDAMLENNLKKAGLWERNADAGQMLAERQQQREMLKVELDKMARGRIVEQWRHIPASAQVVGGGAQKPKAIDRMVRLPNGGRAWATRPATASEVQKKLTANGNVLEGMRRLDALLADETIADVEKRRRARALGLAVSPLVAVSTGQGAMAEKEGENIMDSLGSPGDLVNPLGRAKLKEHMQFVEYKISAEVRNNLYADPDAVTPIMSMRPQGTRSQ